MSTVQQLASNCWKIETPAKINLFLELLSKRPDGYHELETVLAPIDLFDTLELSCEPDEAIDPPRITIICQTVNYRPFDPIPLDERNLIHQAAQLVLKETHFRGILRFSLTKRIPMQAGLGGGSSDAAATLLLLNRAFPHICSSTKLQDWASKLGSDVPFFLQNSAAICRGRGENIVPLLGCSRLHLMLVQPGFGLSTADVYRRSVIPLDPRRCDPLVAAWQQSQLSSSTEWLYNALELPAIELRPELETVLEQLVRSGAVTARLTGSGSCCFGLYESQAKALQAANQLRTQCSHWIQVVSTMTNDV